MASWLSPSRTGCLSVQTGSTDRQPLHTSLAGRPGLTRAGAPLRRLAVAKQQGKNRWGRRPGLSDLGPAVWVSGTDPQICRRSGGPLGLWLLPGVLGYQGTKLECQSKYNLSGWTGALGPHPGVARMSDWWCTWCHPPKNAVLIFLARVHAPKKAGWWHRDPQVPHRPGSAEHEPSLRAHSDIIHPSPRLRAVNAGCHWSCGQGRASPELGPAGCPGKQPLRPAPVMLKSGSDDVTPKPLPLPPKSGTTNKKGSL